MTEAERLLFDDEALREETTKLYEEHCKTHDTPPTKPLNKDKAFARVKKDIEAFERKQKLKQQEAANQRREFNSSGDRESSKSKNKEESSSFFPKDRKESSSSSYYWNTSSKEKDPLKEFHKQQLKDFKGLVDVILQGENEMIFKGKTGFGKSNDVLNMHNRMRKRRILEIEYSEDCENREAEELQELKFEVLSIYRKIKGLVLLKINPYKK